MELNIRERLMTIGLLPKETNYVTLKIIRDIENELSFSEKELAEYEIKVNDGTCTWNQDKVKDKKVTIGLAGLEIIRKELKKLDDENKLTKDHFSLCEKFLV